MKKSFFSLLLLFCLSAIQSFAADAPAKYVFLMIGDGMGPTIREFYQKENPDTVLGKFPVTVITGTNNVAGGRTDSAASGTAIACGIKTFNGAIGVNKDKIPVISLAKILRDRGYSIGVITSVGLNDATPAAHYANREYRKDAAGTFSDLFASNFDFFAGSFLMLPPGHSLKDCAQLLKLVKYDLIDNLNFTDKTPSKRVVFISSMSPDWPSKPQKRHLLSDTVKFAADSLSKNRKGFFMVVEGGAIDHSAHANDLAGVMREMGEFDKAVQTALDFQKKHPAETLIIITSDHDTGGLNLAEKMPQNTTLWQKQRRSSKHIELAFQKMFPKAEDEKLIAFLSKELDMGELSAEENKVMLKALKDQRDPEAANKKKRQFRSMYGSYNPVVIQMLRLRDARCGVSWTTFSHTQRQVLTNAKGSGQELFKAVKENSDIPHIISMAMLGRDVLKENAGKLPFPPGRNAEEYFKFVSLDSNNALFRYSQLKSGELEFVLSNGKSIKRNDRAGWVTFENLAPSTAYTLAVKRGGKVICECKITTLPAVSGKMISRFAVVADAHVSQRPDARYGRLHSRSAMVLQDTLAALQSSKVDFAAMPGDITDASKLPELELVAKAVKSAKGLKVFGIPGNHDRLKDEAFSKLWNKTFGKTARVEKVGNLQILLLNTGNGKLADKQENKDAVAALDPKLPVIVFSHYQLTADSYINDRDRAIHDAKESEPLLKKLAAMRGMILVGHKNVATTAKLGNLVQINMPQSTQFPAGYAVCEVYDNGVKIQYKPTLNIFYDEYSRLRAGNTQLRTRDNKSLEIWNAFYPVDMTIGK